MEVNSFGLIGTEFLDLRKRHKFKGDSWREGKVGDILSPPSFETFCDDLKI